VCRIIQGIDVWRRGCRSPPTNQRIVARAWPRANHLPADELKKKNFFFFRSGSAAAVAGAAALSSLWLETSFS